MEVDDNHDDEVEIDDSERDPDYEVCNSMDESSDSYEISPVKSLLAKGKGIEQLSFAASQYSQKALSENLQHRNAGSVTSIVQKAQKDNNLNAKKPSMNSTFQKAHKDLHVNAKKARVNSTFPQAHKDINLDANNPTSFKRKPKRPCPYCGKLQAKLKRHLKFKHRNEVEVKNAFASPKFEQNRSINALKKQGILNYNKKMIEHGDKGADNILRERNQGTNELVMCGYCNGFYGKHYLWKHKRSCDKAEDSSTTKASVPLNLLNNENNVSEAFFTEILSRFRANAVGELCKKDKLILEVGKRQWRKSSKIDRKSVMTDMRRLASLLIECQTLKDDRSFTGEDLLKRVNFKMLEEALEKCQNKSSLQLGLGYLLKTAAKTMKGIYLTEGSDEKAQEMDVFLTILELRWGYLFGKAISNIEINRKEKLRKPQAMPLESDIAKLRSYNLQEMKEMIEDQFKLWTSYDFNRLRALLVCRITLFNARRGGEPARLLLTEFEDALKKAWIDPQRISQIEDPIEQVILGSYKLAYQCGKGNKLVPVLITDDCLLGLHKLVELRKEFVNPKNPFLFPFLQNSVDHASGWHCVNEVCRLAKVSDPGRLTATRMRHRASTLYALQELPENSRSAFYAHMGHSKEINENVYQAPLGITEVIKIGGFLGDIDGANFKENIQDSSGEEDQTANDDESNKSDSNSSVNEQNKSDQNDKETEERPYVKWSTQQTGLVLENFKEWMASTQPGLPSKKDVLAFVEKNKLPMNWKTVKVKLFNEKQKQKKLREKWLKKVHK